MKRGSSTSFGVVSPSERAQADLFFNDLMGMPSRRAPTRSGRVAAWPRQPTWPAESEPEDFEAIDEARPLIEGPLTDAEWQSVVLMLGRGEAEIGSAFTTDANRNAQLVAARIFCARNALSLENEDPLLCVVKDVTMADRRVRALVPHVTLRGPIEDWIHQTRDARIVRVMTLLVNTYSYPVNGAAGLVGNLQAESGVLPQRIEGCDGSTPLRAKNFAGNTVDFTAEEVMNRSTTARTGPKMPGIGLAQWTSGTRRSGLFTHSFRGVVLGPRILFDLDGQVDYLVTELRTRFAGVQAVLTNPTVTIDGACDEVLYNFEIPGAILSPARTKLPRSDARVTAVFSKRRPLARNAHAVFTASTTATP